MKKVLRHHDFESFPHQDPALGRDVVQLAHFDGEDEAPRDLLYLGDHAFRQVGAAPVLFRFSVEEGGAVDVVLEDGDRGRFAERIGSR